MKKKNQHLESGDITKHKLDRNKITNHHSSQQKKIYSLFFQNNITNISKTSQGISMLISNTKKRWERHYDNSFKRPLNKYTCLQTKQNCWYFKQSFCVIIGHKLASEIPNSNASFTAGIFTRRYEHKGFVLFYSCNSEGDWKWDYADSFKQIIWFILLAYYHIKNVEAHYKLPFSCYI